MLSPPRRYHQLLKEQDNLVDEKRQAIQRGKGAAEVTRVDAQLKALRERLSEVEKYIT
eukprot:m.102378 g.102378  ORF g.102378 m.102378 type:complete len:58 (-) comp10436_c0_seq1:98-271(-)